MATYTNPKQQQAMNNDVQHPNDGFTVVKSKKYFKEKENNNYNPPSSSSQSRPQNSYNNYHKSTSPSWKPSHYSPQPQPPQQKQQPTKSIKKVSYEEQFPTMTTNTVVVPSSNKPSTNTNINNNTLNFKTAIDKPSTDIKPISTNINKVKNIEEKETFDLSLYVKLQERRQKEYDLLYGEGAFVSDRLNYERFSSDNESDDDSDTDSIKDDAIHDLEIGDY